MADLRDFTGKNRKFTGTEGITPNTTADTTTGNRVNVTGKLRFNSTLNLMEYYNGTSWISIDAPPTISTVSPTTVLESDTTTVFTITGDNFSSTGLTAVIIDDGGTEYNFASVVRNSSTQVTATLTNSVIASATGPFDIKITNGSGLAVTFADQISFNQSPDWNTTAGSLGSISDTATGTLFTLSATDPDGGAITYYETTSNLSTYGISLNGSTGVLSTSGITGISSTTTVSFTVAAKDAASNVVTRSFSIEITYVLDGSTVAKANTTCSQLKSDTGTTTDGLYYLTAPNGTATQFWCDQNVDSGGWMLVFRVDNENTYCNNGTWDFYVLDGGGSSPPTTPFGDAGSSGTSSTYGGNVQRSGGSPSMRSTWWSNTSATQYALQSGNGTSYTIGFKGTQTNSSDMFAYASKGTANGSPTSGFGNATVGSMTAIRSGGGYSSGGGYNYYSHGSYGCNCCEAYHESNGQGGQMLFGDDLGRNGYSWTSFFIK